MASERRITASRLGRLKQVPMPLNLRGYRFLVADTPGFRVPVVARALPGGGFIGLWSGNEHIIQEVRDVLDRAGDASGHDVPDAAAEQAPQATMGHVRPVITQMQEQAAMVIDESFRGMNRVQQQRAVYAALKGKMDGPDGDLHALALTTRAPD